MESNYEISNHPIAEKLLNLGATCKCVNYEYLAMEATAVTSRYLKR